MWHKQGGRRKQCSLKRNGRLHGDDLLKISDFLTWKTLLNINSTGCELAAMLSAYPFPFCLFEKQFNRLRILLLCCPPIPSITLTVPWLRFTPSQSVRSMSQIIKPHILWHLTSKTYHTRDKVIFLNAYSDRKPSSYNKNMP